LNIIYYILNIYREGILYTHIAFTVSLIIICLFLHYDIEMAVNLWCILMPNGTIADSKSFVYAHVFLFLLFIHLFIFAYIVWAISPPPIPLASRQNLFCPLLKFCWKKNIRDNKKDIAFLLAWDKDSYTERFLALLPCTCVLQPALVQLYQTSSPLPSHLPIVASVSLRLLYLFLYSGYIKHFQVLSFLPFPISPVCVSPLACEPCLIILLNLF
jgi:hypothetical protein